MERYDLATKAWEAVAPMVEARAVAGVSVLDGKLYAVGGCDVDERLLSSVERYDLATKEWEAVAPMATERQAHGVAVLNGKLYAVGGINDGGFLSSVERFDPVGGGGTDGGGAEPARLGGAGRQAVRRGRLQRDDGNLSSVERYDPAVGAWEAVAPMALARFGAGVAALEGKLYALGGRVEEDDEAAELDRPANTVERYDPATNAWEECCRWRQGGPSLSRS